MVYVFSDDGAKMIFDIVIRRMGMIVNIGDSFYLNSDKVRGFLVRSGSVYFGYDMYISKRIMKKLGSNIYKLENDGIVDITDDKASMIVSVLEKLYGGKVSMNSRDILVESKIGSFNIFKLGDMTIMTFSGHKFEDYKVLDYFVNEMLNITN